MSDVLIDSNVIARFLDTANPRQPQIQNAISQLTQEGRILVYVPQVVAELANFLTRPVAERGFGFSAAEAVDTLDRLEQLFVLGYPDAETEYRIFRELHGELRVIGKQAHDLRLVAACRTLGIPNLFTLNPRHFARAAAGGHIEVMTPEAVDGHAP